MKKFERKKHLKQTRYDAGRHVSNKYIYIYIYTMYTALTETLPLIRRVASKKAVRL